MHDSAAVHGHERARNRGRDAYFRGEVEPFFERIGQRLPCGEFDGETIVAVSLRIVVNAKQVRMIDVAEESRFLHQPPALERIGEGIRGEALDDDAPAEDFINRYKYATGLSLADYADERDPIDSCATKVLNGHLFRVKRTRSSIRAQ